MKNALIEIKVKIETQLRYLNERKKAATDSLKLAQQQGNNETALRHKDRVSYLGQEIGFLEDILSMTLEDLEDMDG